MSVSEENQIIQYIIDAQDRITYVGNDWWFFAEENGADANCYPPQLLGRSLWDFIAGEETRHLYGILIDKVRQTNGSQRPAPAQPRCLSGVPRGFMGRPLMVACAGDYSFEPGCQFTSAFCQGKS